MAADSSPGLAGPDASWGARRQVGRVQIQAETSSISDATSSRSEASGARHAQNRPNPSAMPSADARLAASGMARRRRQSRSAGPKPGWSRSQASSRGAERANPKAARMRKGVVGSSGTTTPTRPSASAAEPSANQSRRIGVQRAGSAIIGRRSGSGRGGSVSRSRFVRPAFARPAFPSIAAPWR